MNKVKLTMNELFSGIGAQKRGIDLTDLFDLDVMSTSDIDKDAMLSYAAIHHGLNDELISTYNEYPSKEEMAKLLTERNIGFDFKKNQLYNWDKHVKQKNKTLETYYLAMKLGGNLGDISLIKTLPYADLWTYSFPCQDLSVAGKGAGIKKGTRSGLLLEVERLLEISVINNSQPKYLLLENVKNLVGKNNKEDFDNWLNKLDELGYNTYWEVVNGKDCGVPQNRERVFAISIRKDVDTKTYTFMKPFDNGLRLKDILENEVEEKYYLSQEIQDRFQLTDETFKKNIIGTTKPEFRTIGQRDLVYQQDSIIGALVATDYKQPKQIYEPRKINAYGKIVEINEPMALDEQNKYVRKDFCVGTLTTDGSSPKHNNRVVQLDARIRKLTPLECLRLMGFEDSDHQKLVINRISDTQIYHQAGNSIITYCIKLLMEHLYKAQYDESYICSDENFTRPQVD